MSKAALLVAVALSLAACGSTDSYADSDDYDASLSEAGSDPAGGLLEEREPFDEDGARERAEEEVASEGYDGPCTLDCSGHEAGFEWAADGNPDYGTSRSPSFDEGQEAYEDAVNERVEEYRDAYDSGEDDY